MPTISSLVRDVRLTNIAMAYKNEEFIADQIFPKVMVSRDSDYYAVYGKENFNMVDTKISRADHFPETYYTLSDTQYKVEKHGLKAFVDYDDEDAASTTGMSVDADTTEDLMQKIMLAREVKMADTLLSASAFTNEASCTTGCTTQWSVSGSDPVGMILSAALTVRNSCTKWPNSLIISFPVYRALLNNTSIRNRLSANVLEKVTPDALRTLFEVENIIVGGAQYNSTNAPGTATISNYVWQDDAILAYINPSVGRKRLTLGLRFVRHDVTVLKWAADTDQLGRYIGIYYKEAPKLTEELCGFQIRNVI